jgi:predicted O-methyltransferase YrrM
MKSPSLLNTIDFLTDKLDLYNFRVRLASLILAKKTRKCKTPKEYINLSSNIFRHIPLKYIGWPISPIQIESELQILLNTLQKRNIHRMLEIGTAQGGTLFLFSQALSPDATIISLDLPQGMFGGGYESFKIPFYMNFAEKNQHMHLLRDDSHSPLSLSKVKSILRGQKLDFLFIDGDHTYDGVKRDYRIYAPLVCKGGLIAFHDICKHPPSLGCEVDKFWNEIKTAHSYQEIIDSPHQNWAGIGVLYN